MDLINGVIQKSVYKICCFFRLPYPWFTLFKNFFCWSIRFFIYVHTVWDVGRITLFGRKKYGERCEGKMAVGKLFVTGFQSATLR